ncbi:MAG: pyruvate formate lyase family protein [Anaerolineales bacterium]
MGTTLVNNQKQQYQIKEPTNLSPRIKWLRDYFFQGVKRPWRNDFLSWTTGTPWDVQYNEALYYIVPEAFMLLATMKGSFRMMAREVELHPEFWSWSLAERRTWFNKEVMVNRVPQEMLPGDLLAGARFNILTSLCLNKKEAAEYDRLTIGKNGARKKATYFHDHGYGNSGATSGHLIPAHENALKRGWKGIYADLQTRYEKLPNSEKDMQKGAQYRAMIMAALMPKELAAKYATLCRKLANEETDITRKDEFEQIAKNLDRVPWEPAETFWEAVQALWFNHMLIMADENYPGAGTSLGRIDQYLLPYWEKSLKDGMPREFGKEIMKCFWFHCNTVYDAMIKNGPDGITASFGQLISLGGMDQDGKDASNDLTFAILEVIDEMSPILEPKPNVRLCRNSSDKLLDKVVDMVASSQGAPFLLNFDERSMAGLILEAKQAGYTDLINEENVWDYASVGCLENTMVGNDRSGTVDNNINLLKAVELALTGGKDLLPVTNPMTGVSEKIKQDGPTTGEATEFETWEKFWNAYARQTEYIIAKCVDNHENTEYIRAKYFRTPYLSCLVKGCAEKGVDITEGGAEINFTTLNAVTFGTTVDSLLAIKYLVFDKKECTMQELIAALKDNWVGHEILQAKAKHKAPKYGRDDDNADQMAKDVMDLWCAETWKHKTKFTKRQYRPGMLSWNYWISEGSVLAASADGRPKGQHLSNAICPSNGADINGPTANANSVGKAIGGKAADGKGDWADFFNSLPNGASHTMTFNPSILRDPEHRQKFKAFLRAYVENGGTTLQINMLDANLLREAQKHPQDYRHLLVRITGYNAYFVTVGKELQDEVISRISHEFA